MIGGHGGGDRGLNRGIARRVALAGRVGGVHVARGALRQRHRRCRQYGNSNREAPEPTPSSHGSALLDRVARSVCRSPARGNMNQSGNDFTKEQ